MEDLKTLRGKIDGIDRQLASLFEQRMEVCRNVGEYKLANGLPVLDAAREREVLSSKAELTQNAEMKPYLNVFFENIMAQSRALQRKLVTHWTPAQEHTYAEYQALLRNVPKEMQGCRVIYQGQPGAFGEEAAVQVFGEDCQRMNARTFEGVFVAVREGLGEFGVVPIENSSTGSINDVYDLLGRYGCSIVGETIVRVEHCLLAPKGAALGSICQVHSHEQGLGQCKQFLARYPQWEQVAELNTATAARQVAERGDPGYAAIASRRAAKLYDLDILAEKINDNDLNFTRFVVVAEKGWVSEQADKISVIFSIPDKPGSLHRILSIFASYGLDLMKLESRPIAGRSWEYSFFADFTGNLRDPDMDAALRQLIEESSSFRILGNYRAAQT